jgi:hypothetical protein
LLLHLVLDHPFFRQQACNQQDLNDRRLAVVQMISENGTAAASNQNLG